MDDLIININFNESQKQGKTIIETYSGRIKKIKKKTFSGIIKKIDLMTKADKYNNLSEIEFSKIKDIISNKQNKNITIDLIQDVIAAYFNLRVEDLKSQRRTRNIAYPRQIAMYLSRKLTDMSLPKIGEEFGGRDHTTVIHAYEKISEGLKSDESLQRTIDDITKKITQK